MKKFFSIAIMLMAVMAAGAQTDFRHISLDEAAKAAKAEGKLIFIDVYTSWCGPCKMMANKTFPQKLVGDYMNKTFVCVKFDAEKGEGVDVAKLFDVKAYPTFIVATADKTELNRVLGYYEGPKFVEKLQQCVNPENSPAILRKRYADGERTPKVIKGLAFIIDDDMRTMYQSPERDSLKNVRDTMIDSYFSSLSDEKRLAAENSFIFEYYAKNIDSRQFGYMVENRSKFLPEIKHKADSVIGLVYDNNVKMYLSGEKKYDATSFNALKTAIANGGYNADKKYDTAYALVEEYAKGDLDKYLAFCKKNYKRLPDDQLTSFLENFSDKYAEATESQRNAASRFLRSILPELPIRPIYICAGEISKLEKIDKH